MSRERTTRSSGRCPREPVRMRSGRTDSAVSQATSSRSREADQDAGHLRQDRSFRYDLQEEVEPERFAIARSTARKANVSGEARTDDLYAQTICGGRSCGVFEEAEESIVAACAKTVSIQEGGVVRKAPRPRWAATSRPRRCRVKRGERVRASYGEGRFEAARRTGG